MPQNLPNHLVAVGAMSAGDPRSLTLTGLPGAGSLGRPPVGVPVRIRSRTLAHHSEISLYAH
jgi:hypothetical protein